jgi:hypothetical protein
LIFKTNIASQSDILDMDRILDETFREWLCINGDKHC